MIVRPLAEKAPTQHAILERLEQGPARASELTAVAGGEIQHAICMLRKRGYVIEHEHIYTLKVEPE